MITKVHELHCGSFCPIHSHLYFPTENMTCRCLLLETSVGLVLCDTGLPDLKNISSLAQKKLQIMQSKYTEQDLCSHKIKELGFKSTDIKHIFLTHVDVDHAGAIIHFPEAEVHVHQAESEYFQHIPLRYSFRYFRETLPTNTHLNIHKNFGENWYGFNSVFPFKELKDEVCLIPLLGHSAGHCGIGIYFQGRWTIHCGDAFYFIEDLSSELHLRNLASESLQTLSAFNNDQRIKTIHDLQRLKITSPEIRVINSHDPRLSFF